MTNKPPSDINAVAQLTNKNTEAKIATMPTIESTMKYFYFSHTSSVP
jgi:hypothetical protein